jgi:hypothetical protein
LRYLLDELMKANAFALGELMRIDECSRSNITYGNQSRRLVVALAVVPLRLTQTPVQAGLAKPI